MKNKFIIIAVLFVTAFLMQSCSNSNNSSANTDMDSSMNPQMQNDSMNAGKMHMGNNMMQLMNNTMAKVNSMKMSGDFDLDFANMMIMHHQAAIDMSVEEIAKGTDEQIKTMAQNIVIAQKTEIKQLQQFINSYKVPAEKNKNGAMHNELNEAMKTMMDKMNNMQMTGNSDKDFVRMMIAHHESAVKMAEDEISYGKQSEMKKMAQKMSTDQSKEIANFKAWLSNQ